MESHVVLIEVAKLLLQRLKSLDELESCTGLGPELSVANQTVSRIISCLSEDDAEADTGFVQQLRDVLLDLEDILDTICTLAKIRHRDQPTVAKCLFKHAYNTLSRFSQLPKTRSMSHKLHDICERVSQILSNYHVVRSRHVLLNDPGIVKLPLNNDVFGRDVDKALLINMLLSETIDDDDQVFSFVSVVGMGGVGKTTLASLVYSDEAISSMFELRMWVSVSARLQLTKLVSSMLRGSSIGGMKFLLVLDDVWTENPDDWVELRRLLRGAGGARGSKVLLTTRTNMVSKTLGNGSVFELKCLSNQDSLKLFNKVVFGGGRGDKMFDDTFARMFVKKCLNLPLAITVMGQFLKAQGTSRWPLFLDKELAETREVRDGIIQVLKPSYDHLPSSMKTCFTYLSIYPKHHLISKDNMIYLWMAQGFLNPVDGIGESLEDIGERYFQSFMHRSFFVDIMVDKLGHVKCFRLHDFMYDVAQLVSGGEFVFASSAATDLSRQMLHVCIDCKISDTHLDHCLANCTRARSLIRPTCGDCPGPQLGFERKVLSMARCLRSLSLSECDFEKLPGEIGELFHLRYLDLSNNDTLELLPSSITKLVNLETLLLHDCLKLRALPSSIHRLASLRHLETMGCSSLTHMPPGIGRLTHLRTLSMFVVGNATYGSSYDQLEMLKSLTNLRGRLFIMVDANGAKTKTRQVKQRHLHKLAVEELSICWLEKTHNGDDDEYVLESLEPHPNLKLVWLEHYSGARLNSLASCVNLVKIYLFDCPKLKILSCLSRLGQLKKLALYKLVALESIGVTSASTFFPSLESLDLYMLPKLKTIGEGQHTEKNAHQKLVLPCLVKLRISACPSLASFPLCPNVQKSRVCLQYNQSIHLTTAGNPFLSFEPVHPCTGT